jgi:stage III sporulation protein AA
LDRVAGLPKQKAVQMALRTLGPQVILLDELGGLEEAAALEQGFFSGVDFVASLHAAGLDEALRRPQVQYLQERGMARAAALLEGRTAPGRIKEVRWL